jgi:hypothetical protein
MIRHSLAPFVLVFLAAVPAAAQSAPDPARNQSIGGGLQWGGPYTSARMSPGVGVSWRRWFGRNVGVGADVRWKQLQRTDEGGPPGVDWVDEVTHTSYAFGGGLIGRATAGRVSVVGGAGPGMFVERRAHDTRIDGVLRPSTETYRTIGIQGLVEIDLRMTDRLSAFAGLHLEWRDLRSSESSSGYPSAGVRLLF